MSTRNPVNCIQCFACNTNGTYQPPIPGSPIVNISCHNCKTHWHICVICKIRIQAKVLRTHMTSDEHQGSFDNKSQSPSSTVPILPQGTHTTKLPWDKTLRPPDINNCTHLHTRSRIFFGLEIQQPGLGMRHIICQAYTGIQVAWMKHTCLHKRK